MTRATPIALTVVSFFLFGCGSSPQVRYFGLETIETTYQRDPDGSPVISIGPIRIPDYLNRSQMVTRGRGTELLVDDFNRWAENLDGAIHRTIAANVDRLLENVIVVAFPSSSLVDIDYRMIGRFDRFDTDINGLAVLDVQWGIGAADGTKIISALRSHFEIRVTTPGDPAANAQAMSALLEQLSNDVAQEVSAALD
jgi:uncharacterized lipoprotein YmbA